MGKPTGFMEYQRRGNPSETPLERIKHYNEFHPGWAGTTGGGRAPGAWSAAYPSVSRGRY